MKNHWTIKLIALILVAVSGATLAVSGVSIIVNYYFDLYNNDLETKIEEITLDRMDSYVYEAAMTAAVKYVKETNTDPGTTERELWESNYNYTWHDRNIWPEYEYTIYSGTKELTTTKKDEQYAKTMNIFVDVENGIITNLGSARKEFPLCEELPLNYKWESYYGKELPDLDSRTVYYELVEFYPDNVYRLERFADSTFEVEIHMTEGDIAEISQTVGTVHLVKAAYTFRRCDILTAAISAVVLLCAVLYLCFAAGKKPGTREIHPRGTNCIPLDLFFAGVCGGIGLPAVFGLDIAESMNYAGSLETVYLQAAVFGLCGACMALAATLFLMALCAQVRLGSRIWLRRTVIGRCWKVIWSWLKKLWSKLFSPENGVFSKAWKGVKEVFGMIPLMWQWLIAFGVLLVLTLMLAASFAYYFNGNGAMSVLPVLLIGVPLVLYSAYAFGKLRDAAKRMGSGDLNTKIDTKKEFLFGNFREFAEDLNVLGDTCVEAAVERTKSERMKSELITNVSHDIKTPLTSIINYVDLLQRAESEEQKAECLEVLDRQSQRLKKLIEDLMELSKASSGNVNVELMQADVAEAVNQALGEFADRMEGKNLNIIFRQMEQSITASFDGKLLWRVMSNVLGNVVKYALPGTRVYVDILEKENQVFLSFKNISREPLNITADELMERFVRGDASRNSEGNGLGLNIAKGLMEVQGGDLGLTVDGDLFKVTLTLNRN